MGLTVRHAEPSDAGSLHRIFDGPKAIAGTLQLPLPRLSLWRERQLTLNTTPANPRMGHVGSIGMAVRDDWQSRGVGTALMEAALDLADNWLNLTRVELEVYVDNAAGIALYEKFGFGIEGTHRRYAFRDGGFVDAYFMARLKELA